MCIQETIYDMMEELNKVDSVGIREYKEDIYQLKQESIYISTGLSIQSLFTYVCVSVNISE